jgi:hypothetical protein
MDVDRPDVVGLELVAGQWRRVPVDRLPTNMTWRVERLGIAL